MAIAKNITGDSFPVKERRSAEQPPLPCISSRKPIQGSETLAASLTSNARTARVDRRPQAFPNQYDEAVSICVLKLKALRLNLLSNENSVGSKGSDHTHSHILCEELGSGPLRSSASVLALASSSSSMILTGSESSLAAKCSGVRPQRRRKA